MNATVVLIHSPLVGPDTWSLAGESLTIHGVPVVIPNIRSHTSAPVHWHRHAGDVADALAHIPQNRRLALVAHSGAGLLLPAIREMIPHPITGYIFVDAGIPVDGLSRLDLIRHESVEMANQLEVHLESGGYFPEWTEDDLREDVPDDALREKLIGDLRPQPLRFFTESIPVSSSWPDAPCSYVQFTSTYQVYADRALAAGWPVHRIEGGHFHMLVDPDAVATTIRRLLDR